MKQIILSLVLLAFPAIFYAQEQAETKVHYDEFGNVNAIEFAMLDEKVVHPQSAKDFFQEFLKIESEDSFRLNESAKLNSGNELYQQFYKGIRVEDGLYVFHYNKDGDMVYAHGNYVNIENLNIRPSISGIDACNAFVKYQRIEKINNYKVELLIKRIENQFTRTKIPELVYKITLDSEDPNNTVIGYVNAHNGIVVHTESINLYLSYNAQVETFYYGWKTCKTSTWGGTYTLYDDSRGATISTKDLHGLTAQYTSSAVVITDANGDNVWYQSEFSDNKMMGLDVHWALQQIYDRLYNTHGKNSFDNNGMAINAYIRATENGQNGPNCSYWSNTENSLYFGEGSSTWPPYASVDIIAHEFGHGITKHQIGWGDNQNYLNEGLSDIWAAIMEYRILGNSTDVWKIGEEITSLSSFPLLYCIRNLKNPGAYGSVTETASTYLSNKYNEINSDSAYIKGGVFSHWFYLLVNGDYGENDLNQYYSVSGIGMDLAEQLIVKAVFDGYLCGTTTYPQIRTAFIQAALAMGNANLVTQVQDAWHAVGVGERATSITGSNSVCNTGYYTLEDPLPQATIQWSVSNNCLQIVSGQGTTSVTVSKLNEGLCTLTAALYINNTPRYSISKTIGVGTPDLLDIHFNAADGGEGYWNGGLTGNNIEVEPPFSGLYSQYEYEIYQYDNNWNSTLYSHVYNTYPLYGVSLPIGWYWVRVRGINDCGNSDWIEGDVEMMDNWDYGLSYDPSSEVLTLSLANSLSEKSSPQSKTSNTYEIQIWNSANMVKRFTTDLNTFQISLAGLPSGIYYIRVIKDGKSYSRKFIK